MSRVGMFFDLSAMTHYDFFKNKATKNLFDYAGFVIKNNKACYAATYNFRLKTSHERMNIKNDLRWIYKTAQEDVGLGMVH